MKQIKEFIDESVAGSELFKYQNLRPLMTTVMTEADDQPKVTPEDLKGLIIDPDAIPVVFANGYFQPQLSGDLAAAGVHLEQVVDSFYEYHFKKMGGEIPENPLVKFSATNTRAAYKIQFKKGFSSDHRLQLIQVYLASEASEDQLSYSGSQLLIQVDSGVEVQMSETTVGSSKMFYSNLRAVQMEAGARLQYARIDHGLQGLSGYNGFTASLQRDSFLQSFQFSDQTAWVRNDLQAEVLGENAEVHALGLSLLKSKQVADHRTTLKHQAAHSISRQLYKGLLDDKSKLIFNGKIYIAQAAQHVDSSQINKNITLSKHAEVDTKPELEIYADDVKANHGATVGGVDPEELFYLKSRGITEPAALRMLAEGFLADSFGGITSNGLHRYLNHVLQDSYQRFDQVGM